MENCLNKYFADEFTSDEKTEFLIDCLLYTSTSDSQYEKGEERKKEYQNCQFHTVLFNYLSYYCLLYTSGGTGSSIVVGENILSGTLTGEQTLEAKEYICLLYTSRCV